MKQFKHKNVYRFSLDCLFGLHGTWKIHSEHGFYIVFKSLCHNRCR